MTNEYPKWMSRKGESRVVTEAEAKQAIAEGWTARTQDAPVASSSDPHPAPGTTRADPAVLDGPEVEVIERLSAVTDIAVLHALGDMETARKHRVAVMAAIQGRINTLEASGTGTTRPPTAPPTPKPVPSSDSLDNTARDAIAEIHAITDVAELHALRDVEQSGKDRKTVVAAIDARLDQIQKESV